MRKFTSNIDAKKQKLTFSLRLTSSILLSDGHNVNCAELLILIKLLNNMLYNFSSRQFPFTGKTDLAPLIQPKLQFCLNLILSKEPRPVQIIRN